MKPTIDIDKQGIELKYSEGQILISWVDMFINNKTFTTEVMLMIKKAYEDCIREDVNVKGFMEK